MGAEMKYLLMTEAEFEAAIQRAKSYGESSMPAGVVSDWARKALREAEAACRARDIRYVGPESQGSSLILWAERVKK